MKQSPSCEANSHSVVSQENHIPLLCRISMNQKRRKC